MTELEERLRITLVAVAKQTPVPDAPVGQAAVARGLRGLRRRPVLLAVGVGVAAAVAAGVVGFDVARSPVPQAAPSSTPPLVGPALVGPGSVVMSVTGHVTVATVWGSWCGPCREQLPAWASAYRTLAPLGVQFVGIDVRDDSVQARDILAKSKVTFPQIDDPEARLADGWAPPGEPPVTVLVGSDGLVARRLSGVASAATVVGAVRSILSADGGSPAPCVPQHHVDPRTRPDLVWTLQGLPPDYRFDGGWMERDCAGGSSMPIPPDLALVRWTAEKTRVSAAVDVWGADADAVAAQVLPTDLSPGQSSLTKVAGAIATLTQVQGRTFLRWTGAGGRDWAAAATGLTAEQAVAVVSSLPLPPAGSPSLPHGLPTWSDVTATGAAPASRTFFDADEVVPGTNGSGFRSQVSFGASDAEDPYLTPAQAAWYAGPGYAEYTTWKGHRAVIADGRIEWEQKPGLWLTVAGDESVVPDRAALLMLAGDLVPGDASDPRITRGAASSSGP